MQPTGRFIALALILLVLAGACTDDGGGGGEPPTGGTGPTTETGDDGGPTPVQSAGPGDRGTYEYANAGLRVILRIDGTAGTMEIRNDTGRELGRPDFYLLDARDGQEFPGDVSAGAPIPAGETATFDIAFSGIAVRDVGAIALLLGRDNYGLFVRTA
jgi:hypothetical protein